MGDRRLSSCLYMYTSLIRGSMSLVRKHRKQAEGDDRNYWTNQSACESQPAVMLTACRLYKSYP